MAMEMEGPMNPSELLAPSSPYGFPAPYWFMAFFKVFGFILHMCMMHLWYAGPTLGLILWARGGNPRKFARRLMVQMPIIVALGINFGIIPLLFVQVAYHKVFYPSTILMAWPWMSVIFFLTIAYYGVYIYSSALKADIPKLTPLVRIAGWTAALLFIVIGFIFSNEFSLMTNLDAWANHWNRNNVSGAVLGLALNLSDPTFWPRWLLMIGMALMTTSAYVAIDSGLFARKEDDDYRQWAARFAYKPYLIGLLWYGISSLWYIFGTWPNDLQNLMLSGNWLILTALTAAMPVVTWIILLATSRKGRVARHLGLLIGLAQFLVLTTNAISRQVVQNAELARYFDVTDETVRTQWSPLFVFLGLFLIGIGVIIWMLRQLVVARREMDE
jgi:hypothetical protein